MSRLFSILEISRDLKWCPGSTSFPSLSTSCTVQSC